MELRNQLAYSGVLFVVLGALMVGGNAFSQTVVKEEVTTEEERFDLVEVHTELEHPWGMDWLPDGRMIVTERPGDILLIDGDRRVSLKNTPTVYTRNQGGMLDVAVPANYEDTGWIYFTYAAPGDDGGGTALGRARLHDERLVDRQELYRQFPLINGGRHFGSRIVFPNPNTVVFTIGDRGQRDPAQDTSNPIGTTLRLNRDGSIPENNPFVDDPDVLDQILTYGHRNVQGMVIHSETGRIWQNEHGPNGGDELNVIQPGKNYGWPVDTYGTEYTDDSHIGMLPHENPDSVDPVVYWGPTSIAPSGMTYYDGEAFPEWKGNLFLGGLAKQQVRRLVLDGESVTHQEPFLRGLGRIRSVNQGPDGLIYLLTDSPNGKMYRLQPAN